MMDVRQVHRGSGGTFPTLASVAVHRQRQKIEATQPRSVHTPAVTEPPQESLPAGLQEIKLYLEKLFGIAFTLREYSLQTTALQTTVVEAQTTSLSLEGTFATSDGQSVHFQLTIQQMSAKVLNVNVRIGNQSMASYGGPTIAISAAAMELQSFSFQLTSTLPLKKLFIPFTDLRNGTMAFDRDHDGKIDLRSEVFTPPSIAFSQIRRDSKAPPTEPPAETVARLVDQKV